MKRVLLILVFAIFCISCESKRDSCIKAFMEEKDYSYEDACEACDDAATDAQSR